MESNKLVMGNLSVNLLEQDLRNILSKYGSVLSVEISSDRDQGFIEMYSPESAQAVRTAMNGSLLHGRILTVEEVRPPREGTKKKPAARRATRKKRPAAEPLE